MPSDAKACQNCKKSFKIDPEDLPYYEKMQVPAPTWCPECRLVRRLMFRNDRSLFNSKCDLCDRSMFSIYPADSIFPVYCKECWYSDNWDSLSYGQELDLSQKFFDQLTKLHQIAPRLGLFQINAINSPFANGLLDVKNIYLSYSTLQSENVAYSKSIDKSSTVLDSIESIHLEQCYENINSEKNYNSHFMMFTWNCIDSWFLYDCANCKHCVLSANLRNREYVIRNKQYSKEEYFAELEKLGFGSAKSMSALKKEYADIQKNALHKFANILKSVNATGHNLTNTKNAVNCFEVYDSENIKNCYRIAHLKDCMDICHSGWSELEYEHVGGGNQCSNMRFSAYIINNVRNADYIFMCTASSNLFGCISVKNKEYCILNKQYSKEEYLALRPKIIANMNELPYTDAQGRIWKYGEFFPLHFGMPTGYNESLAQDLFPLTKESALSRGYNWRDVGTKTHVPTKTSAILPDSIKDVDDGILNETIGCDHKGECDELCTVAFKIIPDELQFYRQKNLPLPSLCPNCRHHERLHQMEPLGLYKKLCNCAGEASDDDAYTNAASHHQPHAQDKHCANEFYTPYAPDGPETVYCEQCYQAEVA